MVPHALSGINLEPIKKCLDTDKYLWTLWIVPWLIPCCFFLENLWLHYHCFCSLPLWEELSFVTRGETKMGYSRLLSSSFPFPIHWGFHSFLIPLCVLRISFSSFLLGLFNPPRNTFILFNMPRYEEAFVKSFHLRKHHSLTGIYWARRYADNWEYKT